jgi:hypothetical protein
MKATGSRTPKIREQERKAAKTLGIAGRYSRGFGDVREDWDRRGTAAAGETDRNQVVL